MIISIYSAQIDYKLLPAPKIAIYGNLIQSRLIRDINNTIIFSTRKITTNFLTIFFTWEIDSFFEGLHTRAIFIILQTPLNSLTGDLWRN